MTKQATQLSHNLEIAIIFFNKGLRAVHELHNTNKGERGFALAFCKDTMARVE